VWLEARGAEQEECGTYGWWQGGSSERSAAPRRAARSTRDHTNAGQREAVVGGGRAWHTRGLGQGKGCDDGSLLVRSGTQPYRMEAVAGASVGVQQQPATCEGGRRQHSLCAAFNKGEPKGGAEAAPRDVDLHQPVEQLQVVRAGVGGPTRCVVRR